MDWQSARREIRAGTVTGTRWTSPTVARSIPSQRPQLAPRWQWRTPRRRGACLFSSAKAFAIAVDVAACREVGARNACALKSSDRFAERLEGGAHLGGEERRLLPGREMRAFVELVVMDELG